MLDVLIVDDDGGFVETCAVMLRHDGYAVAAADSVQAATARLATQIPDAMLLDWKLLGGSALDVLRWMHARRLDVPTALVTGFWADPDWDLAENDARRLGVRMVVRRAADFDEPTAIVRRLLDPLGDRHAALLGGDVETMETLGRDLPPRVARHLQARFPLASADLVQGAALDAVVWYLRHAAAFDPIRHVSVERFVYRAGRRMLWDGIRGERRRQEREEAYARLRDMTIGPASPDISRGRLVIAQALAREPDRHVRAALRAWLDGDASADPWLAIPAIAVLAPADQRTAVARRKDAFTARVKRLARRPPPENNSHG